MQAEEIEINVVFSSAKGEPIDELKLWEMLVEFAETNGLLFGGSFKALEDESHETH